MTFKRLWYSFRLCMIRSNRARTEYIKRKGIYGAVGEGCSIMRRKVPLYANLIRLGNNVHISSGVSFLTHDGTCNMLNGLESTKQSGRKAWERIGCIDIKDNVWIGAGVRIMFDTMIGPNVIIAAGSIVTHDLPGNSIVAGIPAHVIGRFDEFVERELDHPGYPPELRPKRQTVSAELAEYMWKDFYARRENL